MQMCSYQKYEKSAVVSAFLLVWQVLRSRWWQALTQPIRCCSVLYLCQFSWADLWSIFRAFFQDFPLVVETFVWDIFMGQPPLGWSLIACPGWCHSESKALLCCSSCLLWQEQTWNRPRWASKWSTNAANLASRSFRCCSDGHENTWNSKEVNFNKPLSYQKYGTAKGLWAGANFCHFPFLPGITYRSLWQQGSTVRQLLRKIDSFAM